MAPITAEDFPPSRIKRTGGARTGAGAVTAAPPPPRTRVFPFTNSVNSVSRSTSSSPRIIGPAIIKSLVWAKGGTAQGTMGIVLGKSPVPIQENSVVNTTPLPFTPLFEGLPNTGVGGFAPSNATSEVDFQTNLLSPNAELDIIVQDAEFFLCVSAAAGAMAAAKVLAGYVVVLEQVSLDALRSFQ